MDLNAILARIDERIAALDTNATAVCRAAGAPDAIRNLREALEGKKPERKGISLRTALGLARALGVTVEWLFEGEGPMTGAPSSGAANEMNSTEIPVNGYVAAGAVEIDWHDDSLPQTVTLPRASRLAALQVLGDSQVPRYLAGELLLYDPVAVTPREVIGHYSIVQTMDGRRMIKIIEPSGRPDHWNLRSHNASDIKDIELLSAWRCWGTMSSAVAPPRGPRRPRRTA